MTAKEFFLSVRKAEQEIVIVRQRRQHYMELATGGAGFGTVRRSKGNHHSQVEAAGLSLAGLSCDMEAQEKQYAALIRRAERVIAKLEQPRHKQVLELRYLAGMPWEAVARAMGYQDEKSVYRVHGWALVAAEKIIAGMPLNTT